MTKQQLTDLLNSVKYPNLDKSIVDLKLIDDVKIDGKRIFITLHMQNEEAFSYLQSTIKDLLKDFTVEVSLKALQKKDIKYGSTQKPNNRASYAKKVIAVTSGKGGVGKSTVSTNLSIALAQEGFKVGLLDADVYGPDIPRMLNVVGEKLRWSSDDKILPTENYGIKSISVGITTPSHDTPLVWRSSVAISALIQFLEDVKWKELDFLIIDMPPGTGDVQLTMAQEVNLAGAVIVTTPQQVSIDDVSRAIMMFKEINVPILGLIENMSYFVAPDTKAIYEIFGKGLGEQTSIYYKIPFLGKIPLLMDIREGSDSGKPPVVFGDESVKGYYKEIAKKIVKSF
ncbi:MAG: P-loop NTPase [Campylobacterales bacterium]|nr:P-loop NTPase [Campylobacterales bacterium]